MQPTTPASEQGRSLDNLFEPFIKIDTVAINALIGPQNVNYMYDHPFDGPMTALYFASSRINYGVVKILLQIDGVDVNKVDRDGKTPLLAAACFGYDQQKEAISIIDLLINKGANRHAVDKDGNNALHLTVDKEHSERIKGLISLGVNVNATNNEGKTPLHFSISKGTSKLVKALLDGNADPLFADKDGKTYLHFLVVSIRASPRREIKDITESLIEKGVDINALDNEGKTALQIAVEKCYTDSIEFLLENGANTDSFTAVPNENKTLIEVIALNANPNIPEQNKIINFNELFKHGAEINTQFLEDPHSNISDDIRDYLRSLCEPEKLTIEIKNYTINM